VNGNIQTIFAAQKLETCEFFRDFQKLWNYCNVLRDDGMSYGDYPSAESILSPSASLQGRLRGRAQDRL
jgi:hypothetical protein